MANLGIRKFQDLIGRTDLLKVRDDIIIEKAKTLNLNNVLRNALDLRPGVNIKGGTVKQDFQLENRLDNKLVELAEPVLSGEKNRVDIEMNINNECRAFASTLSYHVAK
jgi:glutamate synthase (NADPH/NADH)